MAKRSGFTLLEFLVVIACIAIVGAVIFPVFASHPERPRRNACLTNVKQLALGVMQYAQDYDERFPNSGFAVVKVKGNPPPALTYRAEEPANGWYDAVYSYVKNSRIYYCPSDESKERIGYPAPAQAEEFASSFTLNKWTATGLETATVKNPAEFVLLAERNNETQAANGSYLFAPWKWSKDAEGPQITQDLALTRHNSGSIVGFSDGHAKWFNPARITEMQTSGAFRP